MALRDFIKDNHDKAERHRFVKVLMSGNISKEIYGEYLINQAFCYHALEQVAKGYGMLQGLEGLERAALIEDDANELGARWTMHPSTLDYVRYIDTVPKKELWAHLYARHFADMYGGQILKHKVPGACRMYEFENRSELIAKVREKLSDDLADEANKVLEFALRLFDEVADEHNL